ncbi:YceI family protein [Candidatus Uhrbacteria bacterium]|nr:YceI family protein [Candidatus Uhrbacteria bacterium]
MRNSLLISAALAVLVGTGAAVYVLQNQEGDNGAQVAETVSAPAAVGTAAQSETGSPADISSAVDLAAVFQTGAVLSDSPATTSAPTLRASSVSSAQVKAKQKVAVSSKKKPTRFRITGGSHANFLAGNPAVVIGSSKSVAGDITLDWGSPSRSSVSELMISAGALQSEDVGLRSIQMNASLPEDENMVFIPSSVSGWPKTIRVGTPITLTLRGTLKIAEETRPATFRGTMTPNANGTLTGSLTAAIARADFNLDYASPDDQDQIKFMIRIIAKAE